MYMQGAIIKMAKKTISALLVIASAAILILLIFGDSFILSKTSVQYETADSVSDIVCRVYTGNAVNDIKVSSTNTGSILFLPSDTNRVEFTNIPKESTLTGADGRVISLPVKRGKSYDTGTVVSLFENMRLSDGTPVLRVMTSRNVSSVFLSSEDSLDIIDSEKGFRHNASSTVITPEGSVLFSGKMDYITPRGTTSFLSPKKSYEIKFLKKTELLKGIKEKEWLLLANYKDNTLIRNAVIFDYARMHTSVLAPHGMFADLYINGEYRGNYYVCEKVKNHTALLNIRDAEETSDITGGYLLKYVDTERLSDKPFITTPLGCHFEVISPKTVTDAQLTYLTDFFTTLEQIAEYPEGINPETGDSLEDYLDIESWADKYLLENIFQNVDSFFDSCYFYKESDSDGGRLVAGPAWDYDLTALNRYDVWDTEQVGDFYLKDYLLLNPAVKSQLTATFNATVSPYVKYNFSYDVYRLFQNNRYSFDMNAALWGTDPNHSVDDFIARTKERLDVIDQKILGNTTDHLVSFIDFENNVIKTEHVKDGECIKDIPICSSWWAFYNGWYDTSNGERLWETTPIFEDKIYKVNWIYASYMIKNGLSELGIDLDKVNEESVDLLAEYYKSQMNELGELTNEH